MGDGAKRPDTPTVCHHSTTVDSYDADMVESSVRESIRRARSLIAVTAVGGIIALVSLNLPLLSIRTDSIAPDFATGDWFVADLGAGLPGALIAALAALAVGVVAVVDGRDWGHGLVAGAGLAIIGWSTLALGLVQIPVAEVYDALATPVAEPYTVTITRRVGYGLLVADVLAGLAMVGISITRLGRGRSDALGPWVAAIGAVGVVLVVVGRILPIGTGVADDWGGDAPVLYLLGRGVQVLLVAVGGIVGFLLVSRVGLGLVVGSSSASAWLVVSPLFDADRRGPTAGELGVDDTHPLALVGIAVVLAAVVTAGLRSWRRDRRAGPPSDR